MNRGLNTGTDPERVKEQKKKTEKITKEQQRMNSIRLLLILLLLAIGSLVLKEQLKTDGSMIVVESDGMVIAELPSGKDSWYLVQNGKLSEITEEEAVRISSSLEIAEETESRNLIQICQKKVCVTAANCPNHDCIKMGEISKQGSTIACLPHRLLIYFRKDG